MLNRTSVARVKGGQLNNVRIVCLMLLIVCMHWVSAADDVPAPNTPNAPSGTKTPHLPIDKKKGPSAPTDAKPDMMTEIEWSADKQSFVEDKGIIVLSGDAWVRYKGLKLEADNIVFYKLTHEMYAEGNARLRVGESEMYADKAYIDATNDVGYLTDATVRVSTLPDQFSKKHHSDQKGGTVAALQAEEKPPDSKLNLGFLRTHDLNGIYVLPAEDPQARTNLILRAEKLIIHSQMHYSAENAFVTTDDMVHPMFGVNSSQVDFYIDENPSTDALRPRKIVAQAARINILGFALFPFPTITYDLVRKNPFFSASAGHSTKYGYFDLNRIGYAFNDPDTDKVSHYFDPTHVYFDLDERTARGPGVGFELDWVTGQRPPNVDGQPQFDRGSGFIHFYAVDESQISAKDQLVRARENFDRRVQPKIDGFPVRVYDNNLLFLQRRTFENAGPPTVDLSNTEGGNVRGYVDFQHHEPLKRFAGLDNVLLDLKYQGQSDRDFMLDYFEHNYLTENQPEALVSLRKPGDNYSVELLYRADPTPFEGGPPHDPLNYGSFTGYQPALTYTLVPTPIDYGFNISGELQAARLQNSFDKQLIDQNDFASDRIYGKFDLSRPFKLDIFNLVPHIGSQQQFYDHSVDGGSTSQGAFTYGLDVTTRFYGTFADVENEALGINGLRHILEPRMSFSGVSDTRADPVSLLDFDQIDNLHALDTLTFSLDQTFQTRETDKNGNQTTVNMAGLDTSIDTFPRRADQKRLLKGDMLDMFRVDGFFRVLNVVKLTTALGFSPQTKELEEASYGFTIDPKSNWRLSVNERYNYQDRALTITGSDQTHIRLDYELSDRWGLSAEEVVEHRSNFLQIKGRQLERVGLTRHYGPLDAGFTYSIDRNRNDKSVGFTVAPAAVYRNLIVPTQDLLVSASEAGGDDMEAPEERNFDPFELLKQRRKKNGTSTKPKGDTVAPPPNPGHDEDVPVPPPPGSNKSVSGLSGNADEAVFKDPRDTAPKKRPAKLDDDDWATPPATPATTR